MFALFYIFIIQLSNRESMERFGEIYGRICRILMEEGCENRLLGDILPEIWNGKD